MPPANSCSMPSPKIPWPAGAAACSKSARFPPRISTQTPARRQSHPIPGAQGLHRRRAGRRPSAIPCARPPTSFASNSLAAPRPREAQAQQAGARTAGLSRTASRLAQPERSRRHGARTPAWPRARWPAKAWLRSSPSRWPSPPAPCARPTTLNPAQQAAYEQIARAPSRRASSSTFLLHGVTGSGKTEVYLNAIDTGAGRGRGALLLVPEIALTPAMAGQFFSRFGDRVAILHSAFTDSERSEQWRRIRSGAAVGGGRHALRRLRARAQPRPDRGR